MESNLAPPSPLLLLIEGRAVGELAASYALKPWLKQAPLGDGHPVVVFPGFIASGTSTAPLRSFLTDLGYSAHCWKQGRNVGPVGDLEERMVERVYALAERVQRKVSLVGWSLGGVYARLVAHRIPNSIRGVITLGSPFAGNPKANHSWRLFERLSGAPIDGIEQETVDLIRSTPPVPTTCIFTRTDGITSWKCCVDRDSDHCENIEVSGSHCGLGFNPLVFHAIADRLSQPEGGWKRFRRSGLRRVFYRRPRVAQRTEKRATHG